MIPKQKEGGLLYRKDEELQEVIVGELRPHNDCITLAEYDTCWPELFKREAERIYSILGEKTVQLEHVGSTSVPELCAKPIIDILLVVENSADEASYVPILEAAGYVLRVREPEWFQHRMFKGPDTDINLHVFSKGVSEIDKMLNFRNRLRSNKVDRNKYAQVKQDLAKNKWRHIQHYADAKTSIIKEIIEPINTDNKTMESGRKGVNLMNPGQEMFYKFFMERTKEDKKEEAKALLQDGFAKQEAGTFDKKYLEEVMPKYFEMIKPEAVEELKEAMNSFASRI